MHIFGETMENISILETSSFLAALNLVDRAIGNLMRHTSRKAKSIFDYLEVIV